MEKGLIGVIRVEINLRARLIERGDSMLPLPKGPKGEGRDEGEEVSPILRSSQ